MDRRNAHAKSQVHSTVSLKAKLSLDSNGAHGGQNGADSLRTNGGSSASDWARPLPSEKTTWGPKGTPADLRPVATLPGFIPIYPVHQNPIFQTTLGHRVCSRRPKRMGLELPVEAKVSREKARMGLGNSARGPRALLVTSIYLRDVGVIFAVSILLLAWLYFVL